MNCLSWNSLKFPLAIATLIAVAHPLWAQEAIELEHAQKAARKLAAAATAITDAPFTVEVDREKPQGIKAKDGGLIVLPDRKLSAELLAAANSAITPVGQLWTLKLVLANDGNAVPTTKLRRITIADDEKEREVQLYYLGASRNDEGALELIVYGKEKEPLARVPLVSRQTTKQEFPIEVAGEKRDDHTGVLTLRLCGQFEAQLLLKRDEG
jgi:hypothetical protein